VNLLGWRVRRGGALTWLSCSPDLTPLDFFFGAMWKTRCTAVSEYTDGSLQQLQILQRTCYSLSGERWTTGGMYTGQLMVLRLKCFAPVNFSMHV
jgi:hypothetical protein